VNSGSDTAFQTNLVKGAAISAAQLYLDLTNASDHLPVVADYTIPLPTANLTGASGLGTNLLLTAVNGVTGGVYIVFMSPNLLAPPANWTAISTNVAGGASFTLTVMNAFSRSRSAQFFRLQTP
jgi:hypothetical protein